MWEAAHVQLAAPTLDTDYDGAHASRGCTNSCENARPRDRVALVTLQARIRRERQAEVVTPLADHEAVGRESLEDSLDFVFAWR